jgi:hypothetical protein
LSFRHPRKVAPAFAGWRAGISLKLIIYKIKYEIPDQVRDDTFSLNLLKGINFSEVSIKFNCQEKSCFTQFLSQPDPEKFLLKELFFTYNVFSKREMGNMFKFI